MDYLTALAVKNIKRHPVQSLLTMLGISLSVAIIVAVFMVNSAMEKSVERTAEELGTGKTAIWIQELTEDVASIGTKQEGFSEDLVKKIMKNTNIYSVHPSLKIYTTTSASGAGTADFYLYGISFENDRVVRNHILSQGRYPANEKEIIMGERLGQELKLKVGSWFTMPTPKGTLSLQVSGFLSPDEGSGTLNNNRIIFADLKTVQKYFSYENKVTNLNIVLKPGVRPVQVLDGLKSLLPPNITAYTDPINEAVSNDSTEKLGIMAFIFAFISIFIAVFVIYNTLSSSVEQNRKEIGLLRLIGMTNKQIVKYFMRQSLIYSIIGSAAGICFGILLGVGLLYLENQILKFQSFFVEMPSISVLLISAGVGILATLVVGLFPAVKASKISPLNVFKNLAIEKQNDKLFTKSNLIGILLLAVGLIISYLPAIPKAYLSGPLLIFTGICLLLDFILPGILKASSVVFSRVFGLPGLLAVQSLHLRLKRTVITVGSITVAVAIFIGLLGSVNSMKQTVSYWYDKTNWADVIVFSVSGAEIDESILNKLQSYPFTQKINPMRYRFITYANERLSDNGFLFQGVDPVKFQDFTGIKVIGGNTGAAMKSLENEHSILINENLSKMIGLRAGDTIKLATRKGPVDFKIVGEVADYSDFVHRMGKVVYGSYNTLVDLFGAKGYTVIQVRLAQGYSQEQAKKQLMEELSGRYNIKVITHDEEKADVSASLDQIFSILYALNVIIFVIVFMGIFNTVLINVLFQIREFAVLRTIGCFSKQIRMIIICEALAMALIGALFASIVGLWLSKLMTIGSTREMGTVINYYMPLSATAILLLVTIITAVIATAYPQSIASGISISKVMQNADEM